MAIIALTLFIAGGCLNPDGSFHDAEGNLLIATPEEIREGRQMLLAIKSEADMPPAMQGGVLFDGDVEAISGGPEASTMATLRVVNRISGAFSDGDRVRVQTPGTARGGVRFVEGRRFRVFAVELDGELRTWSSATVELGR